MNCQTYAINSCFTTGKASINVTLHTQNDTYSITNDTLPTDSRDIVFQAKRCDCVEYKEDQSYYCPVQLNNCLTRRRWQDVPPFDPPFCTNEQTNLVSFAISVSPGLYGLTMIIVIVLFCSKRGEMAISCCCNGIFRGYANRIYASYLLQRDPALARAMVRQWCVRRWATVEAQRRAGVEIQTEQDLEEMGLIPSINRPTALRLRTRAYLPPERPPKPIVEESQAYEDSDIDDPCCMICFAPLIANDKIGDLECNHEFHSECLKVWLKKNNSCPLCLRRDVAETTFNESTSE